MTLDSFFYCAPCRLKILVLPVGKVRPSYFTQCLRLLREHQVTRFEDINDGSLSGALLNPAVFPEGQLMFDFVTDWETQYKHLEDFQHWRKLYAVILSRHVADRA
jgi:trafficking protein particle complex subunit 9